MISQHWFRQWLGAVRQQAITWANVDPELCHEMALLGFNELTSIDISIYMTHTMIWSNVQKYRKVHFHLWSNSLYILWFCRDNISTCGSMGLSSIAIRQSLSLTNCFIAWQASIIWVTPSPLVIGGRCHDCRLMAICQDDYVHMKKKQMIIVWKYLSLKFMFFLI